MTRCKSLHDCDVGCDEEKENMTELPTITEYFSNLCGSPDFVNFMN